MFFDSTNVEKDRPGNKYGKSKKGNIIMDFRTEGKIEEVFGKTSIVFRRYIFSLCLAQKNHGWLTSCVWLLKVYFLAACVYVGVNKRGRKIGWDRAKVILEHYN